MRQSRLFAGRLFGITFVLAALLVPAAWAERPVVAKAKTTNRLAQESSPYLLQHAHNPVEWFPWGPEAFAKATKENKLVFLSIGYSSCHWCHVMERESFDNPDVAKLMNDWFVCIKVDREERPDIDSVYMTALHALGQRGGWPLSMFLTADGKPIIGGTYWPPDDREIRGEKVLGFKSVLKAVHEWQSQNPKELKDQADGLANATRAALAGRLPGRALVDLNRELVTVAIDGLKEEFDADCGGFGNPARHFQGTKFPTPPYLVLLLHEAARTNSAELLGLVTTTLDHMARGGIYDHLGGGFHRYSTERTWLVPHFEKMLYDNAQLVEVYADAFARTKNPLYRNVIEESLAFIDREMTSSDGGFYSALDADSEGMEGRFYVWTAGEIASALPNQADAELFKRVFGAVGGPNFEGKFYIFSLPHPWAEAAKESNLSAEQLRTRLEPMRAKLLAIRSTRPRPFLDTKVLTGWNGQMIAGYAAAGQSLAETRYLETAAHAADFILKKMRNPAGRLLRTYGGKGEARLDAYLDDYAFLVHGLLRLHEATGQQRWLREARQLTDTMIVAFGDKDAGGFFYTSTEHEKLFARTKDQYDGAQPSGNSMAAQNLVILTKRTGEQRYRQLAEKSFGAFAGTLKSSPTSLTLMADALAMFLEAPPESQPVAAPAQEQVAQGGVKRSDAVVKVRAAADKPDASGKQIVTVTLDIDNGWHIYANPVGQQDLESVQTTVAISGVSKTEKVQVSYPEGKLINDAVVGKYVTYEEQAVIKATVQRAKGDTGPLEVTVKFQSCNDKTCLLPATVTLKVP